MSSNQNQSNRQQNTPTQVPQMTNAQQQQYQNQQMQQIPQQQPANMIPQQQSIFNNNFNNFQAAPQQFQQQQYQQQQYQQQIPQQQQQQKPGMFAPVTNFIGSLFGAPQQQNVMPQQQQQGLFGEQYVPNNQQQFNDDEFVEPLQVDPNQPHSSYDFDKLLNFELKALYKMGKLKTDQIQYLPAMVTLNPTEAPQVDNAKEAPKVGVDLICVIDKSGSMQGTKIEMVRKTLLMLLEFLSEKDRLCLVEFSSNAQRLTPLKRITENNIKYFKGVIGQINASGGTTIASGTGLAFKQIQERKYMNNVTSIFILSDGQDGGAEAAVSQQLKTFEPVLTMHSFGFGSDHDAPMMTKLCNLRSGSFYFVNDVSLLDEFFVDALGGLVSVVGEQVEITVRCSPNDPYQGIKISKTHGAMWNSIEPNQQYKVAIPQLAQGQRKDYVLELHLPIFAGQIGDHQREAIVLEAQVKLLNAQTKVAIVKQAQLKLMFYNQNEQLPPNEQDIDVAAQYYRVKGAEVINEARRLCEQNQYEQAQQIIEQMLATIRSNPQLVVAAESVLQDLEQAKQACKPQQFQAYGQKQMCQMFSNNMNQQGINAQFDMLGMQQQQVSKAAYQNCAQERMVNKVQMSKKRS